MLTACQVPIVRPWPQVAIDPDHFSAVADHVQRPLTTVAGSLAAAEQLVEPGEGIVAGFFVDR
jgi:hypothetical protein